MNGDADGVLLLGALVVMALPRAPIAFLLLKNGEFSSFLPFYYHYFYLYCCVVFILLLLLLHTVVFGSR